MEKLKLQGYRVECQPGGVVVLDGRGSGVVPRPGRRLVDGGDGIRTPARSATALGLFALLLTRIEHL